MVEGEIEKANQNWDIAIFRPNLVRWDSMKGSNVLGFMRLTSPVTTAASISSII